MSKTRPFSIYLLKPGFDASNSLNDDHSLEEVSASSLPSGALLFLFDGDPTVPWWGSYFRLSRKLRQASKGALVFLPAGSRWFALSFGHAYHNLKDEAFEHDFGLRVTLNCVDPNELKSTDTLEPGAARRQRTQLPVGSDLTYFDFDRDSAILKSLTGGMLIRRYSPMSLVLVALRSSPTLRLMDWLAFVRRFSGSTRVSSIVRHSLISKTKFGAGSIIGRLNMKLVQGLREKDQSLYLAIPDIVDYRQVGYYASFSGSGQSLRYPDVFIDKYYEYLEGNHRPLGDLTYEQLSTHRLKLTDDEGKVRRNYAIVNCFIFDTALDSATESFHLSEGNWYKVENSYIAKIRHGA